MTSKQTRKYELFRKIIAMTYFFVHAKKIWRKIQKSEIAIYDEVGVELFSKFVSDYSVVYVRGEQINLRVMVKAMLKKEFYKEPMRCYSASYIKSISPRLVLSVTDNDHQLFNLKSVYPKAISVIVQNGVRDDIGDVWAYVNKFDEKPYVDFFCVFGKSFGDFIKKSISGSIVEVGSYRSNQVAINMNFNPQTLVFISQISDKVDDSIFIALPDGTNISRKKFHQAEIELLPKLQHWCKRNSYRLKILARTENTEERMFYEKLMPNLEWDFLCRDTNESSYNRVDAAEIVCGINSTLLLESLARKNKTAVFSIRHKCIDGFPSVFWPVELEETGPFWTNCAEPSEIDRILTYLQKIELAEWDSSTQKLIRGCMVYDYDNSKIANLIASIIEEKRQSEIFE